MGFLEDIRTRLADQGVGSTYGSTGDFLITLRGLTSTSVGGGDNNIGLMRTGGLPQEANTDVDRPTVQVMVRGTADDSTGLEDKVDDVVEALDKFQGYLNDTRYFDIQKQGDIFFLGPDEQQRPLYSINFEVTKARHPECFFFFDATMGVASQVSPGNYTRADTATNYIEGGPQTARLLSTAASGVARIGWFTTS